MLRILMFGIAVTAIVGQGDLIANQNNSDLKIAKLETKNIDPIIVGRTISASYKKQWAIDSKKYKECGLCGEEMQAFPGE